MSRNVPFGARHIVLSKCALAEQNVPLRRANKAKCDVAHGSHSTPCPMQNAPSRFYLRPLSLICGLSLASSPCLGSLSLGEMAWVVAVIALLRRSIAAARRESEVSLANSPQGSVNADVALVELVAGAELVLVPRRADRWGRFGLLRLCSWIAVPLPAPIVSSPWIHYAKL